MEVLTSLTYSVVSSLIYAFAAFSGKSAEEILQQQSKETKSISLCHISLHNLSSSYTYGTPQATHHELWLPVFPEASLFITCTVPTPHLL